MLQGSAPGTGLDRMQSCLPESSTFAKGYGGARNSLTLHRRMGTFRIIFNLAHVAGEEAGRHDCEYGRRYGRDREERDG